MLFNSFEFILVFLPVVVTGFYLIKGLGRKKWSAAWLVIASLFFYAWWRFEYLYLLLLSIGVNYLIGYWLSVMAKGSQRKQLMLAGVSFNLLLLGYFKYADFFLESIAGALGNNHDALNIILPLAISFFTFQQIAYLVDAYEGKVRQYGFINYCLFVSFFPQLIAGPIVHHREMIPQFIRNKAAPLDWSNISVGIAIFSLGLFKKVIIADNLALDATPVFSKVDAGYAVTFFEAWQGALAYSLQLYFDFSGYCDMATGAARCFGIRLPINFNSPYQARNIIDFWRRWHMTLSRFLKDYLYIPLGGNRKGRARRYLNLMTTMLLGGLWHGAGWNFVIWGGLHGLYLCVNHFWQALTGHLSIPSIIRKPGRVAGELLTLLAVVFAWVFFRAETLSGAVLMIEGLTGVNGVVIPAKYFERWGDFAVVLAGQGVDFREVDGLNTLSDFFIIIALWPVVRFLPNVYSMLDRYNPVVGELDKPLFRIRLGWGTGLLLAVIFTLALQSLNSVSEFLYFQF